MASPADSLDMFGRLQMRVKPATVVEAVFDVAMLGHCPGTARWWYLLEDKQTVNDITLLGFGQDMLQLQDWLDNGAPQQPNAEQLALLNLYGVPIPLLSLAQFQVLFPDAELEPTQYRSRLAGDTAWLPAAVADFFQSGPAGDLPDGAKKLWLIRVPEHQAQAAFLPDPSADYSRPERLSAFDRALLIPNLGAIVLPDLERLQIPANLADVRRMRLVNADPVFLPCTESTADDHRERRRSEEVPQAPDPLPMRQVLPPILQTLKKRRPDVQCLFSLPLQQAGENSLPGIADEAKQTIQQIGSTENTGLQAVQFLFPYLTKKGRPLCGSGGLIAGAMVETGHRYGPWRSIAGRRLPGLWQLFPQVHSQQVVELRQRPGIGVLVMHKGQLQLDDERRAAPVVGAAGFIYRKRWQDQIEAYRSGEVARFLGWLQRQLQRLGESWLFNTDVRDPSGKMQLNQFFNGLHRAGALRGALPEQAFSISASHDNESTVIYEIELAPVFPIDRIILNFSHDLGSNRSQWQLDIKNG